MIQLKLRAEKNRSVAPRRTAAVATAARALAILRLAYFQGAAIKVHAVERLHGARGVGLRHFDESEAARSPSVAIVDQRDFFDRSVLRKQGANTLLRCGERKISDI
jgi:hypothetical protein